MKYLLVVLILMNIFSMSFIFYNYKKINSNIAVIDINKITSIAIGKLKNSSLKPADIKKEGDKYIVKVRGIINKFSKDNNVVILDKKLVISNNVKDLTNDFIKAFIND